MAGHCSITRAWGATMGAGDWGYLVAALTVVCWGLTMVVSGWVASAAGLMPVFTEPPNPSGLRPLNNIGMLVTTGIFVGWIVFWFPIVQRTFGYARNKPWLFDGPRYDSKEGP